jgi:hypothetical protein
MRTEPTSEQSVVICENALEVRSWEIPSAWAEACPQPKFSFAPPARTDTSCPIFP